MTALRTIARTPRALVRAVHDAGLSPQGALRFGAGSFLYWRFSRPLFLGAVPGSHLVARSPLRRLMNVLLLKRVKSGCLKERQPAHPGVARSAEN